MTEQRKQPWYQIRNAAKDDNGPAELLIYDEIDSWFGVSAEQLARDVAALDDDRELTVRINSPGGNAYDGVAILNSLRSHKGKVTCIIDGIAASAASYIAMAGDEIVMNRNSEMMVHNGRGLVMGGYEDMRKMADRLEQINNNIASIYAERTGGTVDDWLEIMAAETWYSADEAVKAGLADRVEKKPDNTSARKVAAKFDLSAFNHAGRANAPAPKLLVHNETPPAVEVEASKEKENTVATLSESALQKLGLDAEADESAIDAAIGELADKAAEVKPEGDDAPVEPTIEQAAAVAAKFGQKLVNSAHYDQMTATVADLSARRDQQITAENEAVIMDALRTGRIDAKSADTWRAEIAKNREGTTALIATLPENKALPVEMIGHGVDNEGAAIDAEMASVFARVTGTTLGKDA